MIWNDHFKLAGQHAFLSASKYHWINYDPEKLNESWQNFQALARGTKLHALARGLIEERIRQARSKTTFNMYVNDAIGYGMTPEQVLYYSENCFGTADAISFKNNTLRIHDLKTGSTPAHMEQLEIYAALFCLEYRKKPDEIHIELRIYQNDEVETEEPDPNDIYDIMDRIVEFDRYICEWKAGD